MSAPFRKSWAPFIAAPFWIVSPWLGFDPFMVMGVQTINLFWEVMLHAQVVDKLGPLEKTFNTPSHHRVHHGYDDQYRDRNFGGILIIWDRLFGTFTPETTPVHYGLQPQMTSNDPVVIGLHGFVILRRKYGVALHLCRRSRA